MLQIGLARATIDPVERLIARDNAQRCGRFGVCTQTAESERDGLRTHFPDLGDNQGCDQS